MMQGENVPILLYVPVPHKGYLQFFERHRETSSSLWLIESSLAREFSALHAEIREIDTQTVRKMIASLELFREILVLEHEEATTFEPKSVITAREAISQKVIARYFPEAEVIIDDTIFLRYDELSVKSLRPTQFDRESSDLFDMTMMRLAFDEAEKSPDWWRHVGAVLVRDRQVLASEYNRPALSEHMPYIIGNPRDFIEAGTLSHFSDTLHSEKRALASLLRRGISTEGVDIYVSVFPCPDCAKLIVESGIRRCFFGSGHASLDGETVLRARGVELIYVRLEPRP